MKLKLLFLVIVLNISFTRCSMFLQKKPEVQIDEIKKQLEEGKTEVQKQELKIALKVLETSSFREKANYPKKYDMKMSIDEIFIELVKDRSFTEVIQLSQDYIEKQGARIELLEKEIAKRRFSKTDLNDKDIVSITDFKIITINDYFYINALVTDSSLTNEEKTYFYHIEISLASSNKVLDTVGFVAGDFMIHTNGNNLTIDSRVSENLRKYLLSIDTTKFPIEKLSDYNLDVNNYVSIFTRECRGFSPLKEDALENKSIEELKKDLIRFKQLKSNLDNIETLL